MVNKYFDCQKFGSKYVIRSAPTVDCYDKAYFELLPLPIFFFFLYCAGIPSAVVVVLLRKARSLEFPVFYARTSYVFVAALLGTQLFTQLCA